MLHFIRERAQGWIAWIIVGLITIPFALWGINQYFTGGGQARVAVVNGVDITLPEFQQAMQNQKDRMRSMMGGQVSEDMIERLVRPEDVLNFLVESELMLQAAKDMGLGMSAQDFRMRVQNIPEFQEDGKFSLEKYQAFLKRQPGFEYLMREDIIRNQVRSGVMDTGILASEEFNNYLRLKDQQRSFRYAEVSAPKYIAEVQVSDQDMKDYYDKNGNRFMVPEQVSLQYVELKLEDIKKGFSVTDAEIGEAYEREKERFGIPEERRASHILIQVDADADEAARTAARARAEEVLKKVQAGGDFAALAKEYSQDPGSASQGGDLGFFAKGVMTPPFENAVFGMNKGDTSGIVESDFGYHIIRLTDIRSSSVKPLAEVRDELKNTLLDEKANARMREKQEELSKLAFDDATSLDGVSKKLGLEIHETGFITKGGSAPGIAGNRKIVEAAFSKEVLQDGYNSEVLEATPGHLVVIRKKEHHPEKLKSFDEVKAQVEKILRKERAEAKAEEEARKLLVQVEQGGSLEDTAKSLNLPFFAEQRIGREEQKVDAYVVEMLFRMEKKAGMPSVKAVRMTTGNQAIVELTGVYDGDPAVAEEAKKKVLQRDLANAFSGAEFMHYLEALKSGAKVRLFPENIK